MAHDSGFQQVDVAALIVHRDDRILAVYNPEWGAYTLPMTKRRAWQDPANGEIRHEEWLDAAIRARAECLRGTSTVPPQHVPGEPILLPGEPPLYVDPADFRQSSRDHEWKRYTYQLFSAQFNATDELVDPARCEWLTPAEFADPRRRPISKTARELVARGHK